MKRKRNGLIASLPPGDGSHLGESCTLVHLREGDVLQRAEAATTAVYFPIDARVCLLAATPQEAVLQVGMVGSEGMVGAQAAYGGGAAPMTAVVQAGGDAMRSSATNMQAEMDRSVSLRFAVHRQAAVTMRQIAASAACLCVHELPQRLARWLLMTRDCAGSASFSATHEGLAILLGVRRSGVTHAAHDLQQRGLIKYSRGRIKLLDIDGLQAASCGCYRTDRRLHALLLRALPLPGAPA